MSNQFRIAKLGKNALTATDPNDFIFHSSYNSPMVVGENTHSPTLGTTASETFTNKTHGLNYTPFTYGFCKFANNRVGLPGTKASNVNFWFTNVGIDSTNVKFGYNNFTGGNYSPTFKYLATEIPLSGTPSITDPGGNRLVIAKDGYNALSETNPNNKIYDSQFKSLKYYLEGTKTINVPSGSDPVYYEETIVTHSLGYYPFFTAVADISSSGYKFVMPIVFSDAGFENYDFIYATTTALLYRSERNSPYGTSWPGYSIEIKYKVFSFDLGF